MTKCRKSGIDSTIMAVIAIAQGDGAMAAESQLCGSAQAIVPR